MQPYTAVEFECLGLSSFLVGEAATYLHRVERAVAGHSDLAIEFSQTFESYLNSPFSSLLFGEGMSWLDEEKKLLDCLVRLIPNFVRDGERNSIYQALLRGQIRIVPFVCPMMLRLPTGSIFLVDGMRQLGDRTVLLSRHRLFDDPLGILSVLYCESMVGIHQRESREAYAEQIMFCSLMLVWLLQRKTVPGADIYYKALESRVQLLRNTIAKLA